MNKLPKNFKIENLESLLKSKDSEIFIDFSSSQSYNPSVFNFFLQVLCTKIRTVKNLEIVTNLDSYVEQNIIDSYHHFYHLLSLILFKANINITDKNGFMLKRDVLLSNSITQFNIQEDFYSYEFDDIKELQGSAYSKVTELRRRVFSDRSLVKINEGLSFFIPCFDHIRALKNSSYFYNGDGSLRSKDEVISWVRKIFQYNKLNIRKGIQRNNIHEDLALVIKELFDNTEEWARYTYDGKTEYKPNLRSLFINIYMENRLQKLSGQTSEATFNYIAQLSQTDLADLEIPNWQGEILKNSKIGLCEISILDVGPGMAPRWLGKDYSQITQEEEVDAVKKCFNKYSTSDVSGRSSVRGRGLNSVIKVIGKNGFLHVRTGRHSFYRNFLFQSLNEKELQTGGIDFSIVPQTLIEGTSISILYPFIYSI